jgi:hypothetical protein
VSVDFFTVPTIRFQVLYVFLVLLHECRRIIHFNVTVGGAGKRGQNGRQKGASGVVTLWPAAGASGWVSGVGVIRRNGFRRVGAVGLAF